MLTQRCLDLLKGIKKITNDFYRGNIGLTSRTPVRNPDNSISTEHSITIEEDGEYINIPTVVNGKIISDEQAIEHYHKQDAGDYADIVEYPAACYIVSPCDPFTFQSVYLRIIRFIPYSAFPLASPAVHL